ncbi:hypothetical protein MMC13_006275 [Lambiella insularis]|nr:hypothetical protein [Lambiella insularis]
MGSSVFVSAPTTLFNNCLVDEIQHPSSPLAHEWKTPKIHRVKAHREAGLSATDVKKKEGIPRRILRHMLHGPNPRMEKSNMTNAAEVDEAAVRLNEQTTRF